ncbi:hypothetical protein BsWGS_12261 [Bradybaena similaris]
MAICQTTSIESYVDEIPQEAKVVFDWDNTLKVTSADRKHIECGLHIESLNILAQEKRCSLYIISAIRPTRMNLDTLLLEVDRLGLRKYFCPKCRQENFFSNHCSHDIKPQLVKECHTYAHWGNVIICEYDKAEVFLELTEKNRIVCDETDRSVCDITDSVAPGTPKCDAVYFFDDEDVNIHNFHHIVNNSKCVLVKKCL